VIELRHFQELSYDEIARTLKRPLSAVKSDLFRARKQLAERLKDIV
jgi:DNA-directed RNA polymerase specialized sigma24 family protein